MAPKAVAAKVTPNDNPAANPIEGAKNVLITDAKTIESIFQNIFQVCSYQFAVTI